MDVLHERPIHKAISVSFAFMMQDSYPELGLHWFIATQSAFDPTKIENFCLYNREAMV